MKHRFKDQSVDGKQAIDQVARDTIKCYVSSVSHQLTSRDHTLATFF